MIMGFIVIHIYIYFMTPEYMIWMPTLKIKMLRVDFWFSINIMAWGMFDTQQLPAPSPIFCQSYTHAQTPVKWNAMISIQEIISAKVARKMAAIFVSASMP